MEVGKLNVSLRTEKGKGYARRLRNQGLVPGVCYGTLLEEPLPIVLDPKALKRALDPEKRHNTVINLTVKGANGAGDRELVAMLKDFQVGIMRRDVTHVDLVAIDPNQEVEIEVPIVLVGKPKGVVDGGQTHIVRREMHVSAKPADIPAKLELDISGLGIGDALHISDIVMPSGVEPVDAVELAVVTLVAPEKEDKPAAEAATEAVPAVAGKADDKKAAAKPAAKEEKK
jgi:large subunit ribosomal protein L25